MACLGTLTLCPRDKREKDRPRCPGTAPSLSDSRCCQESLLLLSTDLLAKEGGQHRGAAAVSLPTCQPQPGTARIFALPPPRVRPASPSAFITARLISSVPACLPLPPGIQTLRPILPRRGLGPINLWTNVKESGGGATFQVLRPKEQIKPDVCRPARRARHQGELQQLPTQSARPS